MAVAYDNTTFVSFVNAPAMTITTGAFTVGSGANRAAALCLEGASFAGTPSSFTGSLGGTAGAVVANTDSGLVSSSESLIFGVTAPPAGSQTATMSWTTNNANTATLGVHTATGVDQTTPINNGGTANGTTGNPSLAITSTNGDLTFDTAGAFTTSFSAGSQTVKWNDSSVGAGAGSIGPGTGTTTHGWTSGGGNWIQSGANFKQVASLPDSISPANITSSAGRFIGWTV